MSVIVTTTDPAGLLSSIKADIDSKKIDTWEYDNDGDFTHTPAQWRKKAWLRPTIGSGQLTFNEMKPEGVSTLDPEIYGVYNGRFIEMLLVHFRSRFSRACTPS